MPSIAQKDALAALYLCMARIRAFENAAEILSQGGVSAYNKTADGSAKVRGPLHLSTGQEVMYSPCQHKLLARRFLSGVQAMTPPRGAQR